NHRGPARGHHRLRGLQRRQGRRTLLRVRPPQPARHRTPPQRPL
ncbi:Xylose isomerase (EC 5.3.1.5), partial [Arthrobacter sp. DR-2P]